MNPIMVAIVKTIAYSVIADLVAMRLKFPAFISRFLRPSKKGHCMRLILGREG